MAVTIIGLVISVGLSLVSFLLANGITWMVSFVVPAYIISALFVSIKFFLTGGLINFAFGIKSGDLYFDFAGGFGKNPVPFLFLIAFGIGLFYLIIQMGIFLIKRIAGKMSANGNELTWANWKYAFYFFASIIFIPMIFLMLNLTFSSVFQVLDLMSLSTINSTPTNIEEIINHLSALKAKVPDYVAIQKHFESWIETLPNEDAKRIGREMLATYKQYFTYLTTDRIDGIINGLKNSNLQPLNDLRYFYNTNYFLGVSQFSNSVSSLNFRYDIVVPTNIDNSLKQINDLWKTAMDNNVISFITANDPFSNPFVISLYQAFTGKTDTNWTIWTLGVIDPNPIDAINWVQVVTASIVMSSITLTLIGLTITTAMLVFQIIYQLIVAPFLLAKGIDDDGYSFINWFKTTTGLFVVAFVIGFVIQLLMLLNPLFIKQMNSLLTNKWLIDNNVSVTDSRLKRIIIYTTIGIFVAGSFMVGKQFSEWVKAKTLETNGWSFGKANSREKGSSAHGQLNNIAGMGGNVINDSSQAVSKYKTAKAKKDKELARGNGTTLSFKTAKFGDGKGK